MPIDLSFAIFIIAVSAIFTMAVLVIFKKFGVAQKLGQIPLVPLVLIFLLIRALDGHSTFLFVSNDGIRFEGNVFARLLFTEFGLIPGLILHGFLGLLIYATAIFFLGWYLSRRWKIPYPERVLLIIFTMGGIFVVIGNYLSVS